jgi:TP901 family phage tail tape measure protein
MLATDILLNAKFNDKNFAAEVQQMANDFKDRFDKATANKDILKGALAQMKLAGEQGTESFKKIKDEIAEMDKTLKAYEDDVEKVGETHKKGFTDSLATLGLALNTIESLSGKVRNLVQPFKEVDTEMRNVAALGVSNTGALTDSLLALSDETGRSMKELWQGIGNAVGSGAAEMDGSVLKIQENMQLIETATKLAISGSTSMETSMGLLTSTMNSYGYSTAETAKLADTFFHTVNVGVISFDSLASQFGRVATSASTMGVDLEVANAAIAQFTQMGVQSAQAFTNLSSLMAELQSPSENLKTMMESLGITLDDFSGAQMFETLQKIRDAADATGITINELMSSKLSADAVKLLTGENFKSSAEMLKSYYTDAAGEADKAFKITSGSIANTTQAVMTKLENFGQRIFGIIGDGGVKMLDIIASALPTVSAAVTTLSSMKSIFNTAGAGMLKLIAHTGVFKLSIIQSVVGALGLSPALAAAGVAGTAAGTATSIAFGPVTLVALAIAAIGIACYLLYKKVEPIRQIFDALWNVLKQWWSILYQVGVIIVKWIFAPFILLYEFVKKILGVFGLMTSESNMIADAINVVADALGVAAKALEGFSEGMSWVIDVVAEGMVAPFKNLAKAIGLVPKETAPMIKATKEQIESMAEAQGKSVDEIERQVRLQEATTEESKKTYNEIIKIANAEGKTYAESEKIYNELQQRKKAIQEIAANQNISYESAKKIFYEQEKHKKEVANTNAEVKKLQKEQFISRTEAEQLYLSQKNNTEEAKNLVIEAKNLEQSLSGIKPKVDFSALQNSMGGLKEVFEKIEDMGLSESAKKKKQITKESQAEIEQIEKTYNEVRRKRNEGYDDLSEAERKNIDAQLENAKKMIDKRKEYEIKSLKEIDAEDRKTRQEAAKKRQEDRDKQIKETQDFIKKITSSFSMEELDLRIKLFNSTAEEAELINMEEKFKKEIDKMNKAAEQISIVLDFDEKTAGMSKKEIEKYKRELEERGIEIKPIIKKEDRDKLTAELAKTTEGTAKLIAQQEAEKAKKKEEQAEKTAAKEKERTAKLLKEELDKQREFEALKIALISDADRQKYEKEKFDLDKKYADDLKKYEDNLAMRALITEKFHKDLQALQIRNAKIERNIFVENTKQLLGIINAEMSNLTGISANINSNNVNIKNDLSSIKAEENALKESLDKREIDYAEYSDKLLEIDKKYREKQAEINNSPIATAFLEVTSNIFNKIFEEQQIKLKEAQDAKLKSDEEVAKAELVLEQAKQDAKLELARLTAEMEVEIEKLKLEQSLYNIEEYEIKKQEIEDKYRAKTQEANEKVSIAHADFTQKQTDNTAKQTELTERLVTAGASAMISSFVQLKKEGASTQKALLVSLLAGLKASIPVYVAEIVAKSFATNPILGAVIAGVATAAVYAVLSVAESAVANAKFFKGGFVKARNSNEYGVDKIKAYLTHGEAVIPTAAVSVGKNRAAIEYLINNGGDLEVWYEKNNQSKKVRERLISADKKLQQMIVREMQVNNELVKQTNKELIEFRNSMSIGLERLETADFHKNINIDANVTGDANAFIKEVEFVKSQRRRR